MSRAPCIGIDLGTCKCCIGVWQNGKVEIIPNDIGQRTTPSYLSFTDEGRLIGDIAKNKITRNPTNTLYNIKRLLDVSSEIKKYKIIYNHFLSK